LAPLVFVVLNSFNSSALGVFPPQGFSLQWYERMLAWPPFATGFRNSVIVGLVATILALAAGVPSAYALTRYRFRTREALQSYFLSPLIFPRVALALGAYIAFLELGQALGARSLLLGTPLALIIVHALLGLPIVIVIMSAAIVNIDPALEDAALDLGASPAHAFRRVVVPLIARAAVIAAVFAFIFSFDEVETTFFLAPISTRTLPVEMYIYMERELTPVVAALSTLLLAATFTIVVLMAWRLGIESVTRAASRR
jgi:putative spermidine/putrescine transport system permease protein